MRTTVLASVLCHPPALAIKKLVTNHNNGARNEEITNNRRSLVESDREYAIPVYFIVIAERKAQPTALIERTISEQLKMVTTPSTVGRLAVGCSDLLA